MPAASALLAVFFSLMLRPYVRGEGIDCGCSGPGEAISPITLLRDGGLWLVLCFGLLPDDATIQRVARQAVDLRGGVGRLGQGSRKIYEGVRQVAAFQDRDRPMEEEIAVVGRGLL